MLDHWFVSLRLADAGTQHLKPRTRQLEPRRQDLEPRTQCVERWALRMGAWILAGVSVFTPPAECEIVPIPRDIFPRVLIPGVRIEAVVALPAEPPEWGGAPAIVLFEVEVLGSIGPGGSRGRFALRSKAGEELGTTTATTTRVIAPESRIVWNIGASSQNFGPSEPAAIPRAFDGDPQTFWHTQWEGGDAPLPHRVTIEFPAPVELRGLRYLPRQSGSANGTIGRYRLRVELGEGGETIFEGEWPNQRSRDPREIVFEAPLVAGRLELLALSEIHGSAFASAAEITPLLVNPQDEPTPMQLSRAYVLVPVAALSGATEVVVELRGEGVKLLAIGGISLLRFPARPTRDMLGKSNGVDGPDRVDLGPLGIDTYTVDRHAPLPVIAVRDGSPAALAGLRAGDILVGVDGASLPISTCAVGDAWFERGHEPVLGRAIEAALAREGPTRNQLVLDVVRGSSGAREDVSLTLRAPRLPDDFPFDEAATAALERDLIDYVVRTQKADGSWSTDGNDFIQTTFSALALLGTRDPAHAPRVLRAVRWTMRKFREPDRFGNLGYWAAGYATILAAEWHLATGDRSVLPFLENTFEWATTTAHTSAWRSPTLGHGPSGLPYEQKALVAPAAHLLVGEALAKRCGVNGRLFTTLLPFFEAAWSDPAAGGHGALGYNASHKDLEEFWSRSGLFALAATLRGERLDMAKAMTAAMRKHHTVMRGSHAYGAPGNVLGLLGLGVADPPLFSEVMKLWRFSFTAAWEPGFGLRYSTPHMGSPYMGEEGLINPGFAALLSVRRNGLHITGATDRDWLPIESIVGRDEGVALQLLRGRDGRVSIVAPGCEDVRIDLDGKATTNRSPRYLGPFFVREFAAITASAYGATNQPIATTRKVYSRSKAAIRVLEASGWPDATEALRRADALFDEDGGRAWIVDRGEGAALFPHRLGFDLGEPLLVCGLALEPGDQPPREIEIHGGEVAEELTSIATASLEEKGRQVVMFDVPRRLQFLRIVVKSGHAASLSIAEIDVVEPTAGAVRDDSGRLVLEANTADCSIRYTTDGSMPTVNSPRYESPFSFDEGFVLWRCFVNDASGPVDGAWFASTTSKQSKQ